MRQATQIEEDEILGFFNDVERNLAAKVCQGRVLAIEDQPQSRIVSLVDRNVWELPDDLWADAPGGLQIGELVQGVFTLDLQGAARMAVASPALCVRVAEKAAQIWLYHRKILGISIESYAPNLRRGDACIVTNPRGEAIGIGRVIGSLKGSGEAVEPLHDLGEYLRDQ